MAEDDDSQKTEEPSQKRLDDARLEGQVPISREVTHWFMMLGILFITMSLVQNSLSGLTSSLGTYLEKVSEIHVDEISLRGTLIAMLLLGAKALALPVLLMLVLAPAGSILQNGLLFSAHTLAPKFSKISPMAGFKRLFSVRNLVEFSKGLSKLLIVGTVAMLILKPMLTGITHFTGMAIGQVVTETRHMAVRLLIGVVSVMTLIAGFDLIYQRLAFLKQMRMTKQELKDEYKQTEGDPMIKARLRRLRLDKVRRRMMAAVPKADVIITNPTHYAIAMQYDTKNMAAPTVIAKGQDMIALKIREIAKEHDIPIVENPPLARALYATVEIDQEITPEHYRAVAEIISYVYKLKKRTLSRLETN
jgi:flagellar biosynthetic protein FlhB